MILITWHGKAIRSTKQNTYFLLKIHQNHMVMAIVDLYLIHDSDNDGFMNDETKDGNGIWL